MLVLISKDTHGARVREMCLVVPAQSHNVYFELLPVCVFRTGDVGYASSNGT